MFGKQGIETLMQAWFVSVAISLLSAMASAQQDQALEQARIQFLLDSIAHLDSAVFIRNGTEHSAAAAAEHLAYKLSRAQKSYFAPDKSEWTAEMFIEKLATQSSLSAALYKIRFADGSEVPSGEWLKQQLLLYPPRSVPEEGLEK
jgi:hypothetical protein